MNLTEYTETKSLDSDESVWYSLQEQAPISIGAASESRGNLKLRLKYVKETLHLEVVEASGLLSPNPEKPPNTFVKCFFLPDKSRKSKKKTSVKKKTASPSWGEKFEYKGNRCLL